MGEHRPYKPRVTGSSPVPPTKKRYSGVVAQLVRVLACHARGREFESRQPRHFIVREILIDRYLLFFCDRRKKENHVKCGIKT